PETLWRIGVHSRLRRLGKWVRRHCSRPAAGRWGRDWARTHGSIRPSLSRGDPKPLRASGDLLRAGPRIRSNASLGPPPGREVGARTPRHRPASARGSALGHRSFPSLAWTPSVVEPEPRASPAVPEPAGASIAGSGGARREP